jgi:hypothetical protein
MRGKETGFAERIATAAIAKRALLDRARASAPENDPGFAGRRAAREAAGAARDARVAERSAAKLAEAARLAEEDAAQAAALAAAMRARDAERVEKGAREVALEAERKSARDKRYAARKARQR